MVLKRIFPSELIKNWHRFMLICLKTQDIVFEHRYWGVENNLAGKIFLVKTNRMLGIPLMSAQK